LVPRRPIGTNCWLALATGIALAVWVATSPIGAQSIFNGDSSPDSPSRSGTVESRATELAIQAATPARLFVDTECSGIIEESEGEGFDCTSVFASQAAFPPIDPTRLLVPSPPDRIIPRSLALPLRC
jgi:hypothetical protein